MQRPHQPANSATSSTGSNNVLPMQYPNTPFKATRVPLNTSASVSPSAATHLGTPPSFQQIQMQLQQLQQQQQRAMGAGAMPQGAGIYGLPNMGVPMNLNIGASLPAVGSPSAGNIATGVNQPMAHNFNASMAAAALAASQKRKRAASDALPVNTAAGVGVGANAIIAADIPLTMIEDKTLRVLAAAERDRTRAANPDYKTPFSSKSDLFARLLPYHTFGDRYVDAVVAAGLPSRPVDKDRRYFAAKIEGVVKEAKSKKARLEAMFSTFLEKEAAAELPAEEQLYIDCKLYEETQWLINNPMPPREHVAASSSRDYKMEYSTPETMPTTVNTSVSPTPTTLQQQQHQPNRTDGQPTSLSSSGFVIKSTPSAASTNAIMTTRPGDSKPINIFGDNDDEDDGSSSPSASTTTTTTTTSHQPTISDTDFISTNEDDEPLLTQDNKLSASTALLDDDSINSEFGGFTGGMSFVNSSISGVDTSFASTASASYPDIDEEIFGSDSGVSSTDPWLSS